MRLLPFLPAPRRLPWVFLLLPLLCFVPPARANTYQYSFTTAQLLTALSSEVDYSGDGYYAVLLQPTTLTGYSITGVNPRTRRTEPPTGRPPPIALIPSPAAPG